MTTRIIGIHYPAPEHTVFHPNAFDGQIGQRIDLTWDVDGEKVRYAGILMSVKVDDDGRGALLMLDVSEEAQP